MKPFRVVALLLSALVLGCTSMRLPAPTPASELPEPPRPAAPLRAAAARVDVTPPPGVSTWAHGALAEVTDGYWTRIYCRVFALETDPNNRVALIPCDLPAIGTLLQRSVAARVADVLPTTRIMMTATHTHAGPGHYFESLGFGGTLSSKAPGFDPAMLSFLADRVAEGVRRAFGNLAPAEARWAHYERGDRCDDPPCGLWGLTWNRSLAAHLTTASNLEGPEGLCAEEKAIDPSLHVLRLDEIDTTGKPVGPIGVISFFAMHPTVLPASNRLIGGDTHTIISRIIEHELASEWKDRDAKAEKEDPALLPHDPLHGVVNTNEGNVSPVWVHGTKTEAIGVATKVAARIDALLKGLEKEPSSKRTLALDLRYLETDMPDQSLSSGLRTCKTAELGESFAYGACDHLGTIDGLPFASAPCDGQCQAPKQTFVGPVMHLLAGGESAFPVHVPLALARIGDSLVAFLPAEPTIETGREIKSAVASAFPGANGGLHTFVAGLANGYILYVASEPEYKFLGLGGGCAHAPDENDPNRHNRQSYEASSTLYGPHEAQFFAEKFGLLARSLAGAYVPGIGRAESRKVSIASAHRFPTGQGEVPLEDLASWRGPGDVCTVPGTRLVCFQWRDARPGRVPVTHAPWVELVESGKPVEACASGNGACGLGAVIDDRGYDFVTRVREEDSSGGALWSTLFLPTDAEWTAMQKHTAMSLRVRGPLGHSNITSMTFSTTHMPPPCDAKAAALCGDYNAPVTDQLPLPPACH